MDVERNTGRRDGISFLSRLKGLASREPKTPHKKLAREIHNNLVGILREEGDWAPIGSLSLYTSPNLAVNPARGFQAIHVSGPTSVPLDPTAPYRHQIKVCAVDGMKHKNLYTSKRNKIKDSDGKIIKDPIKLMEIKDLIAYSIPHPLI